MALLRVLTGNREGEEFAIDRDRVVIGRASDNVVSIEDASISGKHCEILRDGRKFTLRDLGSTNGTMLNEVAVTEHRLSPKDVIRAGSVDMQFDGNDVDPYRHGAAREEDTQVTPRPQPTREGLAMPFGTRRDRRWVWTFIVLLIAACVMAALGYFLVRLAGV